MEIKRIFNFKNGKAITQFESKFESFLDIPRIVKMYDRYFEWSFYDITVEPTPIEYVEVDINKTSYNPKNAEVIQMPALKCDCGGVIAKTFCYKWCETRQYD